MPGATWAQHHSPNGTHRSPAAISRRPAPGGYRRRVEQLDRQLPSPDEAAAQDDDPVRFDHHFHVPAVAQCPGDATVLCKDAVDPRRRRRGTADAACGEHDVDGTDAPITPGQPAQDVGMQRAAESACAVWNLPPQLVRVDVGEYVGVPGHRHDGARAVIVVRENLDPTICRRESTRHGSGENGRQRVVHGRHATSARSSRNRERRGRRAPLTWGS